MEVILPIGQPKVKSFIYEAAPLSILAISDDYLDWFYSNYIQVCSYDDLKIKNELALQFYGPEQAFHSPYQRKQYFSWEILQSNKVDIVDFLKTYITNGYYYYGSLDDYYLKFRPAYMKQHARHDLLILGFSDEKKVFYSLAYSTSRKFECCEIEYHKLELAFHSTDWDRKLFDWTDRIFMLQYYDKEPYKLDLSLIKTLMYQYYNSINTSESYRRYRNPMYQSFFGLQVYDGVKQYFELLANGDIWNDFRVVSLLKEHKVCMFERLKYLQMRFQDNRFIDYAKNYEMVANKADKLLLKQVKYSIVHEKSIFSKSAELIDSMVIMEQKCMDGLLNLLELLE